MIGIAYGVDQSLEKLIGNNQKIQLHSLLNQIMVTELYQLFPGLNVAQLGGSLYGFSADHRVNYYTGHRSSRNYYTSHRSSRNYYTNCAGHPIGLSRPHPLIGIGR
nr:hypothetical protein Itr_chr05CG10500 [Ipomoea trifida]